MFDFDLSKPYCHYFNEISKIPHGSYNEQAISNYLVNFAKQRNLKYIQDESYNVVIFKDASKGKENAGPLLLQGHMDMVCEKNKSSDHNFEKDALQLEIIDEEWLSAKGTTLGADDGVALAYMLAILDDDNLSHPALECCFTVEEETGLGGALRLDTSVFNARRMISLDGSGENRTSISSSGGCDVIQTLKVNYKDNKNPTYHLFVSGLLGGHSAGEIHKEKGNAIKLAARVLKHLTNSGIKLNVSKIEGGLKRNAIPRECEVFFSSELDLNTISHEVSNIYKDIQKEYEYSDPGVLITIESSSLLQKVMDDESSNKLIDYLFLSINGFMHKSMAIEGLTLASLNIGVINTLENEVKIYDLVRSPMESHIDNIIDTIKTLASLFEIVVETDNRYPGWDFKADSKLREMMNEVLKERLDKELIQRATHGGLECGVFAGISKDMDIITYGPIMEDIHTPDERLNLPSFDKSYDVLTALIAKCN